MTKTFDMIDVFRIARAWADLDGKLQEFEADRARIQTEDWLTTPLSLPVYDGYTDKAKELLNKAYGPLAVRMIEVIMH
jgi:hypothetical protein